MVTREGDIELCYVSPEVQFLGAGKLILQTLEAQVARWGLKTVVLTSTLTAKPFYERNGYTPSDEPILVHEVQSAFPMSKSLSGRGDR